jgi:hypothetical protein
VIGGDDLGHRLPAAPPHYLRPKLTPVQRDEIRRRVAEGETVAVLAAEFGVSTRTIRQNS